MHVLKYSQMVHMIRNKPYAYLKSTFVKPINRVLNLNLHYQVICNKKVEEQCLLQLDCVDA